MTTEIIIVLAVLYWTFSVVALAFLTQVESEHLWLTVAVAILWPMLIPVGLIAVPYRMIVQSSSAIRTDLRNRKLLREFDEFLKSKGAANDR